MLTAVDADTALVVIANVALVAPAATVTLAGTLAALVLLLESATTAPLAGAAPLSVTVPVEDCVPPTTVAGLSVSEESVAAGIVAFELDGIPGAGEGELPAVPGEEVGGGIAGHAFQISIPDHLFLLLE